MPSSSSPNPLIAPRGRATLGAAVVLVLLLCSGLLIRQAAAHASTARLSTIRLVTGQSIVDSSDHRWRSDRPFARGGHVSRTAGRRVRVRSRFRYERSGRFSYRLDVVPGVYALHLDVVGTEPRHRAVRPLTMTASAATSHRHRHAIGRVGHRRVYAIRFAARVTSGRLILHFGARTNITSLIMVGRRHLAPPRPTRNHPSSTPTPAPGSTTEPSTTEPSTTEPSTTEPSTTEPSTTEPSDVPTSTDPSTTASSSDGSASPTGSPSPTGSASPTGTAAPVGSVTPEDFGAVGNGVTDDTAALQRSFDQAAGRTVYLPAGHVYAHNAVLHLRVAGLHVTGPGELLATNEQESSVWIEADSVTVDGGVHIATASTTQRWGTWDQMGVRLDGHSDITLRDVTVDGSAAAGIYVGGATHDFVLDHVTVLDTRADGIHMTGGAYNGQVIAPTVRRSGDDGVAIVSYRQDGTPCHDITVASPTVLGTTWGRGVSVVGGQHITETGIDVEQTSAAAVYIGSEGNPWYTAAATDVSVSGGRIVGANTDVKTDHGAVVVLSGESDVTPSDISVSNLTIIDTRSSASRDIGVITYGANPTSVQFSNLTIAGGPGSAYQGNTPQSSYKLRHIVQNGTVLPDQG